MELEPLVLLALLGVAFLAGWVDAVAGGGGLITIPALLAAGMAPHLALGTNKLAGTFGTFSAARAFIRQGLLQPRHHLALALTTLIGATMGTLGVSQLDSQALQRGIPLLICAAGIYVLLDGLRAHHRQRRIAPSAVRQASGGALGFYDGFLGPGTGAFWTSAGLGLFGLDLLRASALARAMNFISNLASLAAFALLGLVDYGLGLTLAAALALGAHLGARSAIRLGSTFIRPVFLLVVTALALRLGWEAWTP